MPRQESPRGRLDPGGGDRHLHLRAVAFS